MAGHTKAIDILYTGITATRNKKLISELHKAVQTEYGGDLTFTVDITYSSPNLVSFTHERMWMCSTMPHPNSNWGTATYHLKNNKLLELKDELTSSEAAERLIAEIKRSSPEGCSIQAINNYSLDNSGLTFYPNDYNHGDIHGNTHIENGKLKNWLKKDSVLYPAK